MKILRWESFAIFTKLSSAAPRFHRDRFYCFPPCYEGEIFSPGHISSMIGEAAQWPNVVVVVCIAVVVVAVVVVAVGFTILRSMVEELFDSGNICHGFLKLAQLSYLMMLVFPVLLFSSS